MRRTRMRRTNWTSSLDGLRSMDTESGPTTRCSQMVCSISTSSSSTSLGGMAELGKCTTRLMTDKEGAALADDAMAAVVARDEEIARQLQAMDNGLRRRKRHFPGDDAPASTPSPKTTRKRAVKRPRGEAKAAKSGRGRGGSAVKVPSPLRQGSSPTGSPEAPAIPATTMDSYCQGCGRLMLLLAVGANTVTQSTTNALNCDGCVKLYSIAPSGSSTDSKPCRASPRHRCKYSGCSMSFLFPEKLEAHRRRVHSNKDGGGAASPQAAAATAAVTATTLEAAELAPEAMTVDEDAGVSDYDATSTVPKSEAPAASIAQSSGETSPASPAHDADAAPADAAAPAAEGDDGNDDDDAAGGRPRVSPAKKSLFN
eukprot:m.111887 g.111887  ORF g.111887 m.111887 type:complete len:370 (-) comp9383_c0_seq6:96-1205(-)